MRNQLAIAGAVAALIVSILALGATIYAFWPSNPEASSVGFSAFDAPRVEPSQALEVGQSEANKASFVGPELPEADSPVETTDADPTPPPPKKAPAQRRSPKAEKLKPAVLQVVTNFEQADVKVNGLAYPEYFGPGEPEGMVLPAGGPYNVEVKFGANTKFYSLYLRPHETRLLLVELSGYNSGPAPAQKKAPPAKKAEPEPQKAETKEEEDSKSGKITVYSKPPGTVLVDGKETGEKTPGSVDLENGRHEVQVKYETGAISEKKIVRVRTGSRIKLFFRERQAP